MYLGVVQHQLRKHIRQGGLCATLWVTSVNTGLNLDIDALFNQLNSLMSTDKHANLSNVR